MIIKTDIKFIFYILLHLLLLACKPNTGKKEYSEMSTKVQVEKTNVRDTFLNTSFELYQDSLKKLELKEISHPIVLPSIEYFKKYIFYLNENYVIKDSLETNEKVGLSENKKFIIKQKKLSGKSSTYNIQLFNNYKSIIFEGNIPGLMSDESEDEIIPFNNGRGCIQKANRLDASLSCMVWRFENQSKITKSIQRNLKQVSDSRVLLSKDDRHLIISYNNSIDNLNKSLTIEKWEIDGLKKWNKIFKERFIQSGIFTSADSKYIGFSYSQNRGESDNHFCILDENGKIILDELLDSVSYDQCNFFPDINPVKLLLQGRTTIYQIDLPIASIHHIYSIKNKAEELIQTEIIKDKIFILSSIPQYKNFRKTYPSGKLGILETDAMSNWYKIEFPGKPTLILNDTISYLKFESELNDFKYYKIKTPLYEKHY